MRNVQCLFYDLDDKETTSKTSLTDYEATTTTMAMGPVKKKDNSWWNYHVLGSSEGILTHFVFNMYMFINFFKHMNLVYVFAWDCLT